MPNFVQLTKEEMDAFRKRRSTVDISTHIEFLKKMSENDIAEITLNEGESKRAEKRRMSIAGTSLGKFVYWVRPQGERILFKVK